MNTNLVHKFTGKSDASTKEPIRTTQGTVSMDNPRFMRFKYKHYKQML